jgi:type II secretory pathway predicted ATPase ExeA
LYDKFFGFKESPFNPGPDPRFLYLSQSHREALASMVYGIEQRRGFIAITGEVGSGKTTLIHSLLSNLDNKTHTAFIFYPSGTYSDLLRNILIEFDIDTEGKSDLELRLQFHHFVIDQFRKARNVALIFDEAQNMSPDVLEHLRLLSNLESPQEKLFQIILAGQPELSDKLDQPELRQLRQRIGIRREIEPLGDREVRNYIEHRLKVAGYEGNHRLFSEKALDLICYYSRGIPRMVNILCDNSLLTAYGLSKREIDESIIKEVLADLKIEEPIEEKIHAVKHPIADYLTIRPFKRHLWTRTALLLIFALLLLTIFLLHENNQIAALLPAEEASLETVEKEPIDQKSEEKTEEISLTISAEKKKEEFLIQQPGKGDIGPASSYPWAVQIYSSKFPTKANHLKDQLKLKGLPAHIIKVVLDGETWYGVRVGFYAMRKEALEVGMKIASEFNTYKDYFAVQSQQGK